jgi:sRNA-binding protein
MHQLVFLLLVVSDWRYIYGVCENANGFCVRTGVCGDIVYFHRPKS